MNTANKIISCMLSVLMLVTGLPLRAADVALSRTQPAGLTEAVERATAQALLKDPYRGEMPTIEQIDRKAHLAVQRIKRGLPLIKNSVAQIAEMYSSLSEPEQKQVVETIRALPGKAAEYMAKHKTEFDQYAAGKSNNEKKQLALNTVLYDMNLHAEANIWKSKGMRAAMTFLLPIVMIAVGWVIFAFSDEIASGLIEEILEALGIGIAGGGVLTLPVGIIFAIAILCEGSATVYFSPQAGGLDCGTLKHRHPCRVKNPELVHKEFLADPFRAVEFFVTHEGTGESAVVYLAGAEGAAMLNDTVDIMLHAPDFNPEDAEYLNYVQKQSYTKTLYWQKLSKAEKIRYLHDFAEEVRK